jgi:hypothetical protein
LATLKQSTVWHRDGVWRISYNVTWVLTNAVVVNLLAHLGRGAEGKLKAAVFVMGCSKLSE